MRNTEKKPFAGAMAFYHENGLPSAWQQAKKFAGKDGCLATMPDIVAARLETKPGDAPWETYYTTLTAEYFGKSKQGNPILIIAHGIGPMSTLDGIRNAYSWEYRDEERSRRGGRITQGEFSYLEAGNFGKVEIVDFKEYCRRYKYPFIQMLRASEAISDPILHARFGSHTEQYVKAHAAYARIWHLEQANVDPENKYQLPTHGAFLDHRRSQHLMDGAKDSDPYIIKVEDASNCSYGDQHRVRKLEDGYALAHLVSTGRLSHSHHEHGESLVLNVSCHEWWNGVRLVGIQASSSVRSGIHPGPDVRELLRKHWRDLLRPMKKREEVGFRALMLVEKKWFTQYPKEGERMDTWEPEYAVNEIKDIGEPVLFRTTVGGYHGCFKFGVNEVKATAPPDANAYYFVTDPQNEWHDGNPTHQNAMVQFYRIDADTSKRLVRSQDLRYDYETLMYLIKKGDKAT